jgi:biopolymer transport protein ExbB
MTPTYLEQLKSYLASGGYVMLPLLLLAMLLWFGLGYRAFTLRRGTSRPIRRVIERVKMGKSRNRSGIIPKAVVAALDQLMPGVPDIKNRLNAALCDFDVELSRFQILTRAIVAVAPLLGLLGTVGGMIETFDSLGDMSLFAQSGGIAGGISLALFTTQMGLAVAIPGLLIGRILEQRQASLEMDIQKIKDIVASMDAHGEY